MLVTHFSQAGLQIGISNWILAHNVRQKKQTACSASMLHDVRSLLKCTNRPTSDQHTVPQTSETVKKASKMLEPIAEIRPRELAFGRRFIEIWIPLFNTREHGAGNVLGISWMSLNITKVWILHKFRWTSCLRTPIRSVKGISIWKRLRFANWNLQKLLEPSTL